MNIGKKELVNQLVAKHSYTKIAATAIVEDFADIIIDNLAQGNTVTLRNFGIFDILERRARSCPNPQTGERIEIPTHWVPRFYPSVKMRAAVKLWEDEERRKMGYDTSET